ncbi:Hsp20/alpha crystallin family protein [Chloroflexota bacterium]
MWLLKPDSDSCPRLYQLLPGFSKNIHRTAKAGLRKTENEVKEEDYYCCGRSYGSFFRSIGLPSNVDAEKIKASYEDGVLEVSLPKVVEAKPKKITVSTKKREKSSK